MAESTWNLVSAFMITTEDAASSTHNERSITFEKQCDGKSVAGAVFEDVDDVGSTIVRSSCLGPFLALSAYLYEATSNTTYSTAANLTTQFIQAHMYNGTVITDTFDISTCVAPAADIVTSGNAGPAIEGLAVWSSVSNDTGTSSLNEIIASTIKFPGWTAPNGINIEEGPSVEDLAAGQKALFVRGLHEACSRSNRTSPVARLIKSYILVQFNALLDLAAQSGSNTYSSNWTGPPLDDVHTWPQVVAIDVLNAASDLSDEPSSTGSYGTTTTPSPQTSSASENRSSSPNVGAIAGGVAGGVLGFLLLIGVFIFYLRCRLRRHPGQDASVDAHPRSSLYIEPFLTSARLANPQVILASPSNGALSSKIQRRRSNTQAPFEAQDTLPELLSSADMVRSPSERPEQTTGADGAPVVPAMVQRLTDMVVGMQEELQHLRQDVNSEPPPTYH